MKKKEARQLRASWDAWMRGNPWDHREHRASGELWDSTGFPSWSVSQSNGGAPRGLFRMSPQCNASSATSTDWRLLSDRVQRGIPKARPHVVIPSSGWSYSVWSLHLPVNVSKEKKLWVIPMDSELTLMDISIEIWLMSSFYECDFGLHYYICDYSLLIKVAVSLM